MISEVLLGVETGIDGQTSLSTSHSGVMFFAEMCPQTFYLPFGRCGQVVACRILALRYFWKQRRPAVGFKDGGEFNLLRAFQVDLLDNFRVLVIIAVSIF